MKRSGENGLGQLLMVRLEEGRLGATPDLSLRAARQGLIPSAAKVPPAALDDVARRCESFADDFQEEELSIA
jgi:hypothetical protein